MNDLATCVVVSIDKLCDDQESSRSSRDDEEGDECEPDQVQSFTEGHAAYGTVRFSYVHSSSERGLSAKCQIVFSCCFFMFLTHSLFSCNNHFPAYVYFLAIHSEAIDRGFAGYILQCD